MPDPGSPALDTAAPTDARRAAPDDASGAGSDEGVLAVHDVSVVREGTRLLDGISLTVRAGEHWALVGPNGAGKTTLFGILGARQFPTRGSASVLGRALGTVDLRELRALVGQVDQRFDASLPITVHDVVLTGATGTPLPLLHREIPAAEEARARDLETLLGIRTIAPRKWHVISAGERSRTLIARSLMPAPRLLLLDEPATGLDVVARHALGGALAALVRDAPTLATVTTTHHLEDLPPVTTHAAVLSGGRLAAAGPVGEVLTSRTLSTAYGADLRAWQDIAGWHLELVR
ncbi:MAG: iron complex transport system ATP-binding protein [Frankiaceae bacterium]|nr:iron complex transport system ATP-binding protein [Frankiaceae bacterium]